jgi:hypothetical protein
LGGGGLRQWGARAPASVGFGGGDLGQEAEGLQLGSSAAVRAGVRAMAVPGAGLWQRLLTAPGSGALLAVDGGGTLLAAVRAGVRVAAVPSAGL